METEDINVQIIDFKAAGIDEQVILNPDGSYTVLIDARASYEAQQYAMEHALKHIRNHDFQKADVQKIEQQAHRPELVPISEEPRKKRRIKAYAKEWAEVNRRITEMQIYCLDHGLDYNEYVMARNEERRLYGGM